jgi:hypothetical protein
MFFLPGSNITCFTFYIHLWPIYWLYLAITGLSGFGNATCTDLILFGGLPIWGNALMKRHRSHNEPLLVMEVYFLRSHKFICRSSQGLKHSKPSLIWLQRFTVEYITLKRHMRHLRWQMSHLSVQTKLETVSSNLHYYVTKQVQLLGLLSLYCLFIVFKYRLYSDIFCYLFSSALLISLNFPLIYVLSLCCLLGLPFASLIRMTSPQLLRIREGLL